MPTTQNDPSKRAGLPATKRRAVGLDDDASNGIGGERKPVAPEPMDRDCNLTCCKNARIRSESSGLCCRDVRWNRIPAGWTIA